MTDEHDEAIIRRPAAITKWEAALGVGRQLLSVVIVFATLAAAWFLGVVAKDETALMATAATLLSTLVVVNADRFESFKVGTLLEAKVKQADQAIEQAKAAASEAKRAKEEAERARTQLREFAFEIADISFGTALAGSRWGMLKRKHEGYRARLQSQLRELGVDENRVARFGEELVRMQRWDKQAKVLKLANAIVTDPLTKPHKTEEGARKVELVASMEGQPFHPKGPHKLRELLEGAGISSAELEQALGEYEAFWAESEAKLGA